MLYLVDTGVLLRVFNRADPFYSVIRQCFLALKRKGHRLAISTQNVAEFWNVSTRPESSRGGYGLSVQETDRRVKILEKFCEILPDNPNLYAAWRKLVVRQEIKGVQVHDARLAAWMDTQTITHIITLNETDFARYEGIIAQSPQTVLSEVSESKAAGVE